MIKHGVNFYVEYVSIHANSLYKACKMYVDSDNGYGIMICAFQMVLSHFKNVMSNLYYSTIWKSAATTESGLWTI